jgi:hypothetical protein
MAAKTAAGHGSRELAKFRATGMADLGIQPHVIEAVLNHVSGHKAGVAGIITGALMPNEKRAAMDQWAVHIQVIIAQSQGANVTKLERKA